MTSGCLWLGKNVDPVVVVVVVAVAVVVGVVIRGVVVNLVRQRVLASLLPKVAFAHANMI